MGELTPPKPTWKQKLVDELIDYWITAVYLMIFFGLFATYRRLILRHYSIGYFNYGFAVLEALILAKVILIIDALKWGRKLESKPLAWSTLYKALIFTAGVFVFTVLEHALHPLLTGKGMAGVMAEIALINKYELTAKCLVIFFSFIPFFAFKEISRVLGENKLKQMFFHRSS